MVYLDLWPSFPVRYFDQIKCHVYRSALDYEAVVDKGQIPSVKR